MIKTNGLVDHFRVNTAVKSADPSPLLNEDQVPDSTVSTLSHDLHRNRRAAFNPYFSKASIRRLEPVITKTLDILLRRLEVSANSGEVVPLDIAFKAVASDVVTLYCFGESTNFLLREDYNSPFFDAVSNFYGLVWWMTHVAWLGPLLNSFPLKVQIFLTPGLESFIRMRQVSLCTFASIFT